MQVALLSGSAICMTDSDSDPEDHFLKMLNHAGHLR
jgi:hypothetical protein